MQVGVFENPRNHDQCFLAPVLPKLPLGLLAASCHLCLPFYSQTQAALDYLLLKYFSVVGYPNLASSLSYLASCWEGKVEVRKMDIIIYPPLLLFALSAAPL